MAAIRRVIWYVGNSVVLSAMRKGTSHGPVLDECALVVQLMGGSRWREWSVPREHAFARAHINLPTREGFRHCAPPSANTRFRPRARISARAHNSNRARNSECARASLRPRKPPRGAFSAPWRATLLQDSQAVLAHSTSARGRPG